MVDDVERATHKTSTPPATVNPYSTDAIVAANSAAGGKSSHAINDAVVLSSDARDIVQRLSQSKSVAEAWLDHMTKPPEPGEPLKKTNSDTFNPNADNKDKSPPLKDSFNTVMADIGWLFEALGLPPVDNGVLAQALAAKMASGGVGLTPPVAEVVARAETNGNTAALFFENVDVTVKNGKVTNAQVARVALTTAHGSMGERFSGSDKPVVIDVGGELQQVGFDALGNAATNQVNVTPAARADRREEQRTGSHSPDSGLRTDDPRHALLIVRSGQQRSDGTLRLKLDALLPIE